MKKEKQSTQIITIIGGLVLGALLIFGFFSILKPITVRSQNTPSISLDSSPVEVTPATIVDGIQKVTLSWGKFNYAPAIISVKQGMPVKITADLSRLSGCYRTLNIAELGVSKAFSEGDDFVEFTPQKTGNFAFSCAMGMGSGKLQVT